MKTTAENDKFKSLIEGHWFVILGTLPNRNSVTSWRDSHKALVKKLKKYGQMGLPIYKISYLLELAFGYHFKYQDLSRDIKTYSQLIYNLNQSRRLLGIAECVGILNRHVNVLLNAQKCLKKKNSKSRKPLATGIPSIRAELANIFIKMMKITKKISNELDTREKCYDEVGSLLELVGLPSLAQGTIRKDHAKLIKGKYEPIYG